MEQLTGEEFNSDSSRKLDYHACNSGEGDLSSVLEKYTCGGCHKTLETVSLLHEHLLREFVSYRSYEYDFDTRTAFPKLPVRHKEAQTEQEITVCGNSNKRADDTLPTLVLVSQETQTVESDFNLAKDCDTKTKRVLSHESKSVYRSKKLKLERKIKHGTDLPECREAQEEAARQTVDCDYDESTDDNLDLNLEVHMEPDSDSKTHLVENKVVRTNSDKASKDLSIWTIQSHVVADNDTSAVAEKKYNKPKLFAGQNKKSRSRQKSISSSDETSICKPVTEQEHTGSNKAQSNTDISSKDSLKEKIKSQGRKVRKRVTSLTEGGQSKLTQGQLKNRSRSSRIGCSYCKQTYFSQKKLNLHIYRKHRDIYPYACHQCDWTLFTSEEELSKHKAEHQTELYHCDLCGKDLTTKEGMKLHKQIHLGEKIFKCDQCDYSSHTRNSLRQHMFTHAPTKSEQCDICGRSFYTKSKLREHLRYCRKEFKHYCPHCGKGFVARGAMQIHIRGHTGEHPFICEICGFATTTAFLLKGHRRTHTGEKPYKCKECGAQLASRETLVRHQRTHSHEKPYVCSHCGKAFTSKWNLNTHLRQHTGETPYKCDICGQGFKQNVLRKAHMRSHSEPSAVEPSKSSTKHRAVNKAESVPVEFVTIDSYNCSVPYEADYQTPRSFHTDVGMNLSQEFHNSILNFSKGHLVKLADDT